MKHINIAYDILYREGADSDIKELEVELACRCGESTEGRFRKKEGMLPHNLEDAIIVAAEKERWDAQMGMCHDCLGRDYREEQADAARKEAALGL